MNAVCTNPAHTRTPEKQVLFCEHDLRHLGIPFSRAQLFKLTKKGAFPTPIKVSANRRAWLASEVYAWLDARAKDRVA
jgi:prophage regulatory protein